MTTQLRRLKRQANAAERYKVLKDEETLLLAQIKALQWQELQHSIDQQNDKVLQHRNQYEERLSQQRHVEKQVESLRLSEQEYRETEADVQKRYYTHATDIARIEQQIKHTQEQTSSWEQELAEANHLFDELASGSEEQKTQIEELTSELSNLEPKSQEIHSRAEQSQAILLQAEEAMQDWQLQWEEFQSQHADRAQQHEVARTHLSHMHTQLERLEVRLDHLQGSINQEDIDNLSQEIDPLIVSVGNAKEIGRASCRERV